MSDNARPAAAAQQPDVPTASSAAEAVLRLATAYQASRALHAAARLGVPDLLADGPRSVEDLAAATDTQGPSLSRLLRALAAFGVFAETGDGRFALGPLGRGCARVRRARCARWC
ncbi:methyltransferase dimerization domain-containing protein [Siccirubricoccus deserti]